MNLGTNQSSTKYRFKSEGQRLDRQNIRPFINNLNSESSYQKLFHYKINAINLYLRDNDRFKEALGLESLINKLTEKKSRKCIVLQNQDQNSSILNNNIEQNTYNIEKYYTILHLLFNLSDIFNNNHKKESQKNDNLNSSIFINSGISEPQLQYQQKKNCNINNLPIANSLVKKLLLNIQQNQDKKQDLRAILGELKNQSAQKDIENQSMILTQKKKDIKRDQMSGKQSASTINDSATTYEIENDDYIFPKTKLFQTFQNMPIENNQSQQFSVYSNDMFKLQQQQKQENSTQQQLLSQSLLQSSTNNEIIDKKNANNDDYVRQQKACSVFQLKKQNDQYNSFDQSMHYQNSYQDQSIINQQSQILNEQQMKSLKQKQQLFGAVSRIPQQSQFNDNPFNVQLRIPKLKEDNEQNPLLNFSMLNKQNDDNNDLLPVNLNISKYNQCNNSQVQNPNLNASKILFESTFQKSNIQKLNESQQSFQSMIQMKKSQMNQRLNQQQHSNPFQSLIQEQSRDTVEDQDQMEKEEFVTKNLWEDYGVSKNDNRFKKLDLTDIGLLNQKKCLEMIQQYREEQDNILNDCYNQISEDYLVQNICFIIMGIQSDIFDKCPKNYFYHTKQNYNFALKHITTNALMNMLSKFFKFSSKVLRLQSLLNGYEKVKQDNSNNKQFNLDEIFSILDIYLQKMVQIIQQILEQDNLTLLSLQSSLISSFQQISLIYDIFFYNYHERERENNQNNKIDFFKFDLDLAIHSLPTGIQMLDILYKFLKLNQYIEINQESVLIFFVNILKPLLQRISDFSFRADWRSNFIFYKEQEQSLDFLNQNIWYFNSQQFAYFRNQYNNCLPKFLKNQREIIIDCMRAQLILKNVSEEHYQIVINQDLTLQIVEEYGEIKCIVKDFREHYKRKQEDLKVSIEGIIKEEKNKRNIIQDEHRGKIRVLRALYQKQVQEEKLKKEIKQQQKRQELLKVREEALKQQQQRQYQRQMEIEEEQSLLLKQELEQKQKDFEEMQNLIKNNQQLIEEEKIQLHRYSLAYEAEQQQMMERENKMQLEKEIEIQEDQNQQQQKSVFNQEQQEEKSELQEIFIRKQEEEVKMQEEQDMKEIKEQLEKQIQEQLEENNIELMKDINEPVTIKEQFEQAQQKMELEPQQDNNNENSTINRQDVQNQQQQNIFQEQEQILEEVEDIDYINGSIPCKVLIQILVEQPLLYHNQLINKALVSLCFEKFKIVEAFQFLKNYCLCQKGEKIDEFIGFIVMDNNTINQTALYTASNFFEEKDVYDLQELFVPKFKYIYNDQEKQGYLYPKYFMATNLQDLLQLQFENANTATSILFRKEILDQYMIIFSFLLKLRFADLQLRKRWKMINKELLLQKNRRLLARKAQSLRHKIQTFMNFFQSYIYLSVIEGAWKMLMQKIYQCQTFREIEKLQENYLVYISKWSFTKFDSQTISQNIARIISVTTQFLGLLDTICLYGTQFDELEKQINKIEELDQIFTGSQNFIENLIMTVKDRDAIQAIQKI